MDDSGLGVPKLEGAPPSEELGRPMMLLNVLSEFCGGEKRLREKYAADFEWSIQAILKHVHTQTVYPSKAPRVPTGSLLSPHSTMGIGSESISPQKELSCQAPWVD